MENFRTLNQIEYDFVWDKFYELFNFKPSVNNFPGITLKDNFLKFDVSDCYQENFENDKLESIAIDIFKQITQPDERIYALDWQHDCFDFDPRIEMERDAFNEWLIPIFPNGDYYIFITKNFKNIWFGHPWEKSITLIGNDIIKHGNRLLELKGIKLFRSAI